MIFSFNSNISELDRVFTVVTYFCKVNSVSEETVCKLKLIVDEVVSNVINYAEISSKISIFITKKNGDIKLKITDSGKLFNPLLMRNPDVTLSLEDRKVGGLGIFLVKEYSKEIKYRRKDSKNILTVVLKIK